MKTAKTIGYVILAIATAAFGVKLFLYGGGASTDPNDSPLYETTLRRALANFKRSEVRLTESPFAQEPAARNTDTQTGRKELARQYLAVAKQKIEADQLDNALPYLEAAKQYAPDNVEVWQYLAVAYAKQGKAEKAREAYAKFQTLSGNTAPATDDQQTTAKQHSTAGIAYYNQGQYEKAVQEFQRSLQLDPSQPEVYRSLGTCYFAVGELDKVVECYKQAAALQPDQADSYYFLGFAYKEAGNHDQAKAAFRKAFQIDPDHTHAHAGLGQILLAEGKKEEAMKEFQYEIDHCQKAIAENPNDVNAYNHLADFYLQNGIRFDEARELLTRALALQPENAVTLSTAAQLEFKTDHYEKAIELIDKAISEDTSRKAYYQMLKSTYQQAQNRNSEPANE